MLNNKILAIVVLLGLQLTTFSCQKKEIIVSNQKSKKYTKKQIEYKIEFPDTVYLNKTYNGIIKYKSLLDTITTSFDDKINNRYVIFYLTIVDKLNSDYKHLKKVAKKYGADNNREIPIYDIKFTETGTYYIDGIINDYIVIDINKKDKEGFALVREVENEERVIHKVCVLRKPSCRTNPFVWFFPKKIFVTLLK